MGVKEITVFENDEKYYTIGKNMAYKLQPVDSDEKLFVRFDMPQGRAVVQLQETNKGVKAIAQAPHFKEPVEWHIPLDEVQIINGFTGTNTGTFQRFRNFRLDMRRATSNGELFTIWLSEDEETQAIYKKYTK